MIRRKLENNIKMDVETDGVEYTHQTHVSDQWRAVMDTVINLWVSPKAGNFFTL
jgi:hypothetical protein